MSTRGGKRDADYGPWEWNEERQLMRRDVRSNGVVVDTQWGRRSSAEPTPATKSKSVAPPSTRKNPRYAQKAGYPVSEHPSHGDPPGRIDPPLLRPDSPPHYALSNKSSSAHPRSEFQSPLSPAVAYSNPTDKSRSAPLQEAVEEENLYNADDAPVLKLPSRQQARPVRNDSSQYESETSPEFPLSRVETRHMSTPAIAYSNPAKQSRSILLQEAVEEENLYTADDTPVPQSPSRQQARKDSSQYEPETSLPEFPLSRVETRHMSTPAIAYSNPAKQSRSILLQEAVEEENLYTADDTPVPQSPSRQQARKDSSHYEPETSLPEFPLSRVERGHISSTGGRHERSLSASMSRPQIVQKSQRDPADPLTGDIRTGDIKRAVTVSRKGRSTAYYPPNASDNFRLEHSGETRETRHRSRSRGSGGGSASEQSQRSAVPPQLVQEQQITTGGFLNQNFPPPHNPEFGDQLQSGQLRESFEPRDREDPKSPFLETTPPQPQLDPSYQVCDSRHFRKGKVLKVLWPEPQGHKIEKFSRDATDESGENVNIGLSKFGEIFYHSIRRFVIIKEKRGHSICLPILTYHWQGLKKRGVNIDDHTVIYMENSKPIRLFEEPLSKRRPIKVTPRSPSDKLDKASRLNYSKTYTIEHNFKVCFIGKVHKDSMPYLVNDFKIVWNSDEDP